MAIPTALLAKVLGGLGVLATAATVTVVATNRPKDGNTQEDPLKALNEKIKALGITNCELGKDESSKTCTLNKAKIENIKFDGKAGTGLTPESASLSLKIEKGYESLGFPQGLRFTFTNSSGSDITIGDSPKQITFKANTTYDYKIKTSDNTTTLEKAIDLADLVNKVGLKCQQNNTNNECSLEIGNVNIWKNENDYLTKGGAATGSTDKKMKVTKDSSGYRQGLKFYFENEEDLSGDNNKQFHLNPNTNYEIDIREATIHSGNTSRKEKKWFLVDKTNEDLNKKIEGLGISNCKLENGATKTSECELDETKVKAIKFSNKTEGSDLTVSGLEQNKKLNLVIERDYKDSDFPSGLRFTFTNSNESEVTIGSSPSITLKGNTSYDFKIKDNTKLEKAWTITTLAAKVGLTCTNGDTTECCTTGNSLNVWKDPSNYVLEATVTTSSNITVTKESSGYFEGLKFTVSQDITLTTTANPSKSLQLTQENKSYEISPKDVSGTKKWFLVEKINT